MTMNLRKLNPHQRRAVRHGIVNGVAKPAHPLFIVAGPGTGKTRTLTTRIAYLIEKGADADKILALAFTNKAADKISQEVKKLLQDKTGRNNSQLTHVGTFHGMAARLLRKHGAAIGLPVNFTICDPYDAEELFSALMQQLGYDKYADFPKAARCREICSSGINSCLSVREAVRERFPECSAYVRKLIKLFAAYQNAKTQQNLFDFDDLLLGWVGMLGHATMGTKLRRQLKYVLVDEFQDTNALQNKILQKLTPTGKGLTCVGDDAQAINGFRGAGAMTIADVAATYQRPPKIIKLERNYRTTTQNLAPANALMATSSTLNKHLWSKNKSGDRPVLVSVVSEYAQAQYVADQIELNRRLGVALSDQAVLFRTMAESVALEDVLAERGIAFERSGQETVSGHIRDVVAILRWAQNPQDRLAGARVLKLVKNIGPAIASNVLDFVGNGPKELHLPSALRGVIASDWTKLSTLLTIIKKAKPVAAIEKIIRWYVPFLNANYSNSSDRLKDLGRLAVRAKSSSSAGTLIADIALKGSALWIDDTLQVRIVVSTIHSAKGQEWPVVYVMNLIEGRIPHEKAITLQQIEEERRVLFVAITRAQAKMHVVVPAVCEPLWSENVQRFNRPSRFVDPAFSSCFTQKVYKVKRRRSGRLVD